MISYHNFSMQVKQSMNLLLWSSEICHQHSYEDISMAAGGSWFNAIVKVFIIVDALGPLSAYLIVVGDSLLLFFQHNLTAPSVLLNKTWIVFFATLFIASPLCFVARLEYLSFTSMLSLLPLVYLMVLQIISLAKNGLASDILLINGHILSALPMIVFAFSCQVTLHGISSNFIYQIQQCMPPIYREIRERGSELR